MKRLLSWLAAAGSFLLYCVLVGILSLIVNRIITKFLDQTLLAQILSIALGGIAFIAAVVFAVTLSVNLTVKWSVSISPSKMGTRFIVLGAVALTLTILEITSAFLAGMIWTYIIRDLFFIAYSALLIKDGAGIARDAIDQSATVARKEGDSSLVAQEGNALNAQPECGNVQKGKPEPNRNRKSKLPIFILSILLALAVGIGVYEHTVINIMNEQMESDATAYRQLKSSNEYNLRQMKSKQSQLNALESRMQHIEDAYSFFYYGACIVEDGEKVYHHYGCDDLVLSEYYIFNVENAEYKGYKPCEHCWN